jgi:rhomboid family GlyGly-CTERM serine protease
VQRQESNHWYYACTWTLSLCGVMGLVNLGLFPHTPAAARLLLDLLQFDRAAILHGQVWRLLTGNLVHWSIEHFLLDVSAFAVVGLMYERALRPRYFWLLLTVALSVSLGMLVLLPDTRIYRGLSGVDSGQFVLALAVELQLVRQDRSRWLWLAPALAIFTLKMLSETATGHMFFGTESLGNIGQPTPLAHVLGAAAALAQWINHGVLCRSEGLKVSSSHTYSQTS